jgi:hypothetical protein
VIPDETIADMPTISTILLYLCLALFGIYLIVAEFLDTVGRLEIVENRWPKVWKALNNRPMRLILLILLCALVAKDIADRKSDAKKEETKLEFPSPPAPPAPVIQMIAPKSIPPKVDLHIKQDGQGNTANPGTTTAPVRVEPCGVFQNGGSNNNASPICAPPERHLTNEQKKSISNAVKGRQITVHVGYMVNVPDAQDYANELCDAIKDGIPATNCSQAWAMVQEGKGSPWRGFKFAFKGSPGPEGQTLSNSPDSPVGILINAMLAAGLSRGVGYPDPMMKDDEVTVIVGPPPNGQ